MKSARIYLWEGIFLYAGKGLKTSPHESHALEIGISLDLPFLKEQDNIQSLRPGLVMIAPEYNHACAMPDVKNWAHIGIESESFLAKALMTKYLTDSKLVYLDDESLNQFAIQLNQVRINSADITEVSQILENLLTHLLGKPVSAFHKTNDLDHRIKKVIEILKDAQESHPPLHHLAAQVELSGSRLVHLFKEQVGIPIRKYILWLRIKRAIMEMTDSTNLTDAALKAGFSDSAHFSRTFMRVFGRPPSEILKNSQIIQDCRVFV